MRNVLLALVCLLLPALAAAQSQPIDDPTVTLFGGYSFLRADTPDADARNEHGGIAQVRVANNPGDAFGIALDFSSHGKSRDVDVLGQVGTIKSRRMVFTAGPQWLLVSGSTRALFHVLGGFGHTRSTLTFPQGDLLTEAHLSGAITIGAVVDRQIRERIAIRILQADYLFTHFDGEAQHNLRMSAGLAVHLGGI